MKAITLLKQNKTVTERAEQYAQSIKRNLQRDIIDTLVSKKESIEDKIFDLGNFNLVTNLNAAQKQMTKEDCEARLKQLIDLAMLSQGLLQGEALTEFIQRSVSEMVES